MILTHQQYTKNLGRWRLMRDLMNSDMMPSRYLVSFAVSDDAIQQSMLDKYYSIGSYTFTNFTDTLLRSYVGSIFSDLPVVEVPNELQNLTQNFDGNSGSIVQFAKVTARETLGMGRYGALVEAPAYDGTAYASPTDAGYPLPYAAAFTAENILNWATRFKNCKEVLVFVALREFIDTFDSNGNPDMLQQEVELRLVIDAEGYYYQQRIYQGHEDPPFYPTDRLGNRLNFIPFAFVGGENNKPSVSKSPTYDIGLLNISHWRNATDFKYTSWTHGQATLVIECRDDNAADAYREALSGSAKVGAGQGIVVNGSAKYLQLQPSIVSKDAMLSDEEQIAILGAKLAGVRAANETAEAARIRASSASSQLETVVGNIDEFIERLLEYCGRFMGYTETQVLSERFIFTLNRKFVDTIPDAAILQLITALHDRGVISDESANDYFNAQGIPAQFENKKALDEGFN